MKILVNGNIVTLKSNVDFTTLKKATAAGPLTVHDENNRVVYAVAVSPAANINENGANFTYADSEGKACMNVAVDPGMTTDQVKEFVVDKLTGAIASYDAFEAGVQESLNAFEAARNAVAESIQFG